ncbi:hypothetical protein BDP81DRAFT_116383 [Colletotrichum phormii]|uniref:Uncharacterized protein n=1 Tax=Colletotrichum phormii TaxID=359342 RepID=A0AAJ0EAA0_9PEZI|nr:uncharacterized protein BDP81DRAFT_116383 [Colletotrichum phormii]KAK1623685.1 hypothetical protein BDP81DRAFT_116383 [Colletotrichum phormii]
MSTILSSSNPGILISFNHLIRSSNLILSTPPFSKRMRPSHALHPPPSKTYWREDDHIERTKLTDPPLLKKRKKSESERGVFALVILPRI